jgi:hypothetical protein
MKLLGDKTLASMQTRLRVRANTSASARMRLCSCGRIGASGRTCLCVPTSLPLALPRTPSPSPVPPRSPCLTSARKLGKIKIKILVAGLKREETNVRFSVFNPQDPQAPRASRAKPQEEKGFFGLVPLVTHPSSIPLLGGLTPTSSS